jgi:hypothetical protein
LLLLRAIVAASPARISLISAPVVAVAAIVLWASTLTAVLVRSLTLLIRVLLL